jgi:hypothetical protein
VLRAFHAGNRGSNPLGDAINKIKDLEEISNHYFLPEKIISNLISNLDRQTFYENPRVGSSILSLGT